MKGIPASRRSSAARIGECGRVIDHGTDDDLEHRLPSGEDLIVAREGCVPFLRGLHVAVKVRSDPIQIALSEEIAEVGKEAAIDIEGIAEQDRGKLMGNTIPMIPYGTDEGYVLIC